MTAASVDIYFVECERNVWIWDENLIFYKFQQDTALCSSNSLLSSSDLDLPEFQMNNPIFLYTFSTETYGREFSVTNILLS